ncbi:MAG: hypothetical protein MUE85_15195 [Microscillaceae bacterium]|jgi:hypothetical protein|nr:hypothetical protein [Microscillaceae bacterium]
MNQFLPKLNHCFAFCLLTLVIISFSGTYAQTSRLQNHTAYLFRQSPGQKPEADLYSISQTPAPKNTLKHLRLNLADSAKKSVQVGGLLHFDAVGLQDKPTALQSANPNYNRRWERQMYVYRARILVGANISSKTSFFLETEIPVIVGRTDANGQKRSQVSPIILDAQVEHIFSKYFSVIAGMQLVGTTRNALQSAAALMALDFGYFQYPYSLFENSALQGNFGRDIGVNLRGFLADERLEYRLGVFNGRRDDPYSPFRVIGRLNYNFLNREKDFYYTGTTLGQGKILAWGGGFDVQDSYAHLSTDLFLDMPLGESGSLTLNTAFSYLSGGDRSGASANSYTRTIPKQTIHFLELGYYFKKVKLQPYFKYENQIINGTRNQFGFLPNTNEQLVKNANILASNQRIGAGINYYIADYNANLKLIYESVGYGRTTLNGIDAEKQRRGEVWLQLQFFIF